jgi:hypothetical protein
MNIWSCCTDSADCGLLLRIAQIENGARTTGFLQLDLAELLRNVIEIYKS